MSSHWFPQQSYKENVIINIFFFLPPEEGRFWELNGGRARVHAPLGLQVMLGRAIVLYLFWFSPGRMNLAFLFVDSFSHLFILKCLSEGQLCEILCWALWGHTSCRILSSNYGSQPLLSCHPLQSPGAASRVGHIRHSAWTSEHSWANAEQQSFLWMGGGGSRSLRRWEYVLSSFLTLIIVKFHISLCSHLFSTFLAGPSLKAGTL